jgi:proteasome lid subunit RPN8/RPN11
MEISVEKAKSPLKSTPSRSKRPSEFEHAARLSKTPKLRFSPTAWAKLLFLRDYGDTEVGGFGITALGDLLYVEDVALVQQTCTSISVAFNDESVADFFDRQVDAGLNIQQFARLWLHTHPGTCPQPSLVDEETFSRVFGKNDWAVIFILAEGGESYARLQYSVGPGASMLLPVAVDYSRPFTASDYGLWEEEYLANVREPESLLVEQKPDSLVQEPTLSGLFGHQRNSTPLFDEFAPGFEEDLWEEFLEFQEARHGE